MTICASCHHDRLGGRVVDGAFVCGRCDPIASVARKTTRGNARVMPGWRS